MTNNKKTLSNYGRIFYQTNTIFKKLKSQYNKIYEIIMLLLTLSMKIGASQINKIVDLEGRLVTVGREIISLKSGTRRMGVYIVKIKNVYSKFKMFKNFKRLNYSFILYKLYIKFSFKIPYYDTRLIQTIHNSTNNQLHGIKRLSNQTYLKNKTNHKYINSRLRLDLFCKTIILLLTLDLNLGLTQIKIHGKLGGKVGCGRQRVNNSRKRNEANGQAYIK